MENFLEKKFFVLLVALLVVFFVPTHVAYAGGVVNVINQIVVYPINGVLCAAGVTDWRCGDGGGGGSVANNAACLNISKPASIGAGQQFFANVTMQNTGTKVWNSDASPHALGSQNPQDNGIWGLGRVGLPTEPISPGQSVTFGFTATAPAAPGTYPFDWKMVEDYVEWFGQTCQSTMVVNLLPPSSPPANLSASCPSPGSSASLSWSPVVGTTIYAVRVNNLANPWSECRPDPLDSCPDTSATSETIAAVPGASYGWWVHGCNSSGCGPANSGGFSCLVPVNGSCSATHYNCSSGTLGATAEYSNQYQWWCNGSNGGSNILCSEAKPAPTASLSASPTSVAYNGRSTLTWSSTNATSCTAPSGNWSNSGTLSGSGLTNPLTSNTTFTFQCTGNGQTSTLQSATVTVGPAPTATLSANLTTIDSGQSATLTWSSTGVTSCTSAGGFSTGGATSGSASVSPSTTSSYQITCSGPSGSTSSITTITVLQPHVSISASPTRVSSGGTSTISWSASDVNSCAVSGPGLSTTGKTGSQAVTISSQSTYTITCQTLTSPISQSVTVNVAPGFQEF